MLKASLITFALLASGSAMAADNSATVTLQDKLMHHGAVVSDDTTFGLGLRFNDLLVDGLFVRGNFDSVSLTPVNNTVEFRTDIGAGFAGDIGATQWEVSANRVINPVIYSGDYTELRARLTRGPVFAEINQGVTEGVNKDTYLAAGVQKSFDALTVGGLVSTVRNNTEHALTRDEFNFNNVEVFAKYNVWRNLDVNVNYSFVGRDRFGAEDGNQVWGGLTYRF